ncbi:serine O-acetyltransferase EpsC [Flavobacterium suzhouense]|uniref:Serine O-acetyltransferase EpsC n=1 Tax=Flavobacterium suzhouense TaxID=1529638 RepID=A0ABW5NSZ8_9FLAO
METVGDYNTRAIYRKNLLEPRIYLDYHKVRQWVDELYSWLFSLEERYITYSIFNNKEIELRDSLKGFLLQEKMTMTESMTLSGIFFGRIGEIHSMLLEDLNAVLQFDPAAKSKDEVLIAYPGFYALTIHRLAHELWQLGMQILPRLISEYTHSKTGIDIHPAAEIGKRFFIDHGTGIVIGETAKIGNDVKIYQGVTLGALSVDKDKASLKRHPTIEDKVILYANATVLGGETIVGEGSVIGGNVWLTESVPPDTQVFHKREIIKQKRKLKVLADNYTI